jgi:hypothetical protein
LTNNPNPRAQTPYFLPFNAHFNITRTVELVQIKINGPASVNISSTNMRHTASPIIRDIQNHVAFVSDDRYAVLLSVIVMNTTNVFNTIFNSIFALVCFSADCVVFVACAPICFRFAFFCHSYCLNHTAFLVRFTNSATPQAACIIAANIVSHTFTYHRYL